MKKFPLFAESHLSWSYSSSSSIVVGTWKSKLRIGQSCVGIFDLHSPHQSKTQSSKKEKELEVDVPVDDDSYQDFLTGKQIVVTKGKCKIESVESKFAIFTTF